MANHYYIISEVLFFENNEDSNASEFVSGTGIDLNQPCCSQKPTLEDIKKAFIDFNIKVEIRQNEQDNSFEILALEEKLWFIFDIINGENEKIGMFRVGRGSDPNLIIDFIKFLGKTHGNFLYYCDAGIMSLITISKCKEEIYKEMFNQDSI